VRGISNDSSDLKGIMASKIVKEQERVKNFRKAHGATKVGEVNIDMVSARIQGYS
jgi:citrate synthase